MMSKKKINTEHISEDGPPQKFDLVESYKAQKATMKSFDDDCLMNTECCSINSDCIDSKFDIKFLKKWTPSRDENFSYEIEDLSNNLSKTCTVSTIYYKSEFPRDPCGHEIFRNDWGKYHILVQGNPTQNIDSFLSVENVTWLGAASGVMKAVYEVDSVYRQLDLLQCRQIWGIPLSVSLNKENRMTTINRYGHKVVTPIVPQGYFDFLLERDRRLKEIMQLFEVGSHPMYIRCHEVLEYFERYRCSIFLVTDCLSNGTIAYSIKDRLDYTFLGLGEDEETKAYIYRLLAGLAYWHDRGKAHTDFRPENILVEGRKEEHKIHHPKILDFGLSKLIDTYSIGRVDMTDSLSFPIGSNGYRPYESRSDKNYSDIKSDVFSFGISLFELLVGKRPFDRRYGYFEFRDWALADFDPRLSSPVGPLSNYGTIFTECVDLSVEAVDLIAKLLFPDPTRRLTAREAMQHPWFDGVSECCRKEVELQAQEVKDIELVNIGYYPIVWREKEREEKKGSSGGGKDLPNILPETILRGSDQIVSELCHLDDLHGPSSLQNVNINLLPPFRQLSFRFSDVQKKPPTVLSCLFRTAEQHEHYLRAKSFT